MHTHRTDSTVLRRVRALLSQAEDPACTADEAAAFSAKAEALIAKHAVDEALLEARAIRGRPTTRRVEFPAPYAKPKSRLLAGIAGAYGCRVLSRAGEGYTVIGYRSDIDAVEMLFTSLLVQGAHGCTRGDRSFRSSYWYGFAARVTARIREQRERTVAEAAPNDGAGASTGASTGAAVVLADRSDDVDRFTREQFPLTRPGRPGRIGSAEGLLAGDTSGRRADSAAHAWEVGPAASSVGERDQSPEYVGRRRSRNASIASARSLLGRKALFQRSAGRRCASARQEGAVPGGDVAQAAGDAVGAVLLQHVLHPTSDQRRVLGDPRGDRVRGRQGRTSGQRPRSPR